LTALEERLNKYQFNAAARLISEGVDTHGLESFWFEPDAPNNWVSLGQDDLFLHSHNLALGFDVGLNVKPDPKANLAGNFSGFFSPAEGSIPRSWRFNGLAQLDQYQVGLSYLSLSPGLGNYANSILLDGLYTGQLGDPAIRDYREGSLLVAAAPLTFISREQKYSNAAISTQELLAGTTLPYDIELDGSYKLQTTTDDVEHTHRIIRAEANRLFNVYNYPLDLTVGAAQRYGEEDDDSYVNKYLLEANLFGFKPVEKMDLNVFFQGLAGGKAWEGDFDEKSFPTAVPALEADLARVWNKDEQHLILGSAARYNIIDDMFATGAVKYDFNPKTGDKESTVDVGLNYTFDLANFALPNYYVTTSFGFEKIKDLDADTVVGKRTKRSVLVERPISETSGLFGGWRLIDGSPNLALDNSKDRYITVGYGTNLAGAKFRIFYDNLATDVGVDGTQFDELKSTERLVLDLLYAF
jgi:hypothetical protein